MTSTTMASDLAREALEPCPFCGADKPKLHTDRAAAMSWVSCASCGLEAPTETGVTDERAVAYWNRRACTGAGAKAAWAALGEAMSQGDYSRAAFERIEAELRSCLSTHTAAGAGPVGEAVDIVASILASHDGRKYVIGSDLELAEEIVETLTACPVEKPGEVERLTRERDADVRLLEEELGGVKELLRQANDEIEKLGKPLNAQVEPYIALHLATKARAETAEAALADMRERLEKVRQSPAIDGLSLAAATALVDLFGGEETDMTVQFIKDGHSGSGFYAWCTEYAEDGSEYLGPASEFSYRAALSTQESSAALADDGKEAGR